MKITSTEYIVNLHCINKKNLQVAEYLIVQTQILVSLGTCQTIYVVKKWRLNEVPYDHHFLVTVKELSHLQISLQQICDLDPHYKYFNR